MNAPTFEHLEEVAEEEIGVVSEAEWDIDPRMMGNVIAGTIAGRLQAEGLRLYGAPEELPIETTVRAAVLLALERRTHLDIRDTRPCVDGVIRYLIEPPFNDQSPHESRHAA